MAGDYAEFCTSGLVSADYYVLYGAFPKRGLLLLNTSQLDGSYPNVRHVTFRHFKMHAVTAFDSGVYRVEGWMGGKITGQRNFSRYSLAVQ